MLPTVVTDPAILAGFLTDASNVQGRAEALVRPRDAAEVAAVLAHCQARGIPVLPSAGRTSTTAGAVPEGGWVMSMAGLSRVRDWDAPTAEAGVLLGELQTSLEARGRFYPPDPTSRHECTLGASIATNASGARSFKYGATRRWIEALEVALPTGELLVARRGDPIPADWPAPAWPEPRLKTAAGYAPPADLVDVFVGSEGTLGVVTAATLRTIPAPADVIGLLAFFPDRAAALRFVVLARAAQRRDPEGPLSPRCLEYYDANCLQRAASRTTVPAGAGAALFCEQEVVGDGSDVHLATWVETLALAGALVDDTIVAVDEPSRQRLLALRHAIPAGINEEVVRNGMPKVGTDLAVPDDALDDMMAAYESAPLPHALFGHVGDNHLHLNLLPRTPMELALAKSFYDELARKAIAHGGTVSAEHGIGKLKRRHLAWMVGDGVLEQFRALKHKLDPNGILGRGNVFGAASADPHGPPDHLGL